MEEPPPDLEGPLDRPSADEVLAGVPSAEEVLRDVPSVAEVLGEQPTAEEVVADSPAELDGLDAAEGA